MKPQCRRSNKIAVSERSCHNPTGRHRKSTTIHSPVTKKIAKISDMHLLLQSITPIIGFRYGLMSNKPARLSLQNLATGKGHSIWISYDKHAHVGGVYTTRRSPSRGRGHVNLMSTGVMSLEDCRWSL